MALSPSIPTSFVPKQPVSTSRRPSSGNNVFLLVAIVIFLLTILTAGGIFLYANYLKGAENARATQLIEEQKKVNSTNVEQFLRLKNRLVVSQTIMNQHVELSQFFSKLEEITLSNVRFTSLSLQIATDRTATLSMVGEAKTFNALAAQSKIFASEPYVKSAIFSNISPNTSNKTVAFSLTATLDPRIVVQANPGSGVSAVSNATSSASTGGLPSVTSASTTPL